MRKSTLKKNIMDRALAAPRRERVNEIGHCMICGGVYNLAVHEIANGPNRQKALVAWFATLVACSHCNCDLLTDKKLWPQSRQLLRLKIVDPENYNLVAFNYLVNPRAPNRITEIEVLQHLPDTNGEVIKGFIESHKKSRTQK